MFREFNLSWQFYGQLDADEIVSWGDLSAAAAQASAAPGGPAPKFGAYFIKGGKIVGAFIEGASAEESAALKALTAVPTPAPEDLSVLKEQGIAWPLSLSNLKL